MTPTERLFGYLTTTTHWHRLALYHLLWTVRKYADTHPDEFKERMRASVLAVLDLKHETQPEQLKLLTRMALPVLAEVDWDALAGKLADHYAPYLEVPDDQKRVAAVDTPMNPNPQENVD